MTGGDFKAVMENLSRCLLVAFVEFAIANGRAVEMGKGVVRTPETEFSWPVRIQFGQVLWGRTTGCRARRQVDNAYTCPP